MRFPPIFQTGRSRLLSFAALIGVLGLVAWWFFSTPVRLNTLSTQEVDHYFYQQVKGSSREQVAYWLYRNGLKIDCEHLDMVFVRVDTKPETLLMVEFSRDNKVVYCEGYTYQGSCPPPPVE